MSEHLAQRRTPTARQTTEVRSSSSMAPKAAPERGPRRKDGGSAGEGG